jgi:hypothetical protein
MAGVWKTSCSKMDTAPAELEALGDACDLSLSSEIALGSCGRSGRGPRARSDAWRRTARAALVTDNDDARLAGGRSAPSTIAGACSGGASPSAGPRAAPSPAA